MEYMLIYFCLFFTAFQAKQKFSINRAICQSASVMSKSKTFAWLIRERFLSHTSLLEGKFLNSVGILGQRRVYPQEVSWPERSTLPRLLIAYAVAVPHPQAGMTLPYWACNENFARVNRIPYDAYIKEWDDVPRKFSLTDRIIKREANNLMIMSFYLSSF